MEALQGRKIWVAGARGMAGAAIARALAHAGAVLVPDPPRAVLDLRVQADVNDFLAQHRPDMVFLAAARVGGIADNAAHPADFIADNLQIETNVITAAARVGVRRLVFLASSCIYPRACPQPMREQALLTGPLEETNRAYAMAKLAGMELVRALRVQHGCDYFSVLPCNLYGPGDTYDPLRSHVIPALMLKLRAALDAGNDSITVWGTGRAVREFMHVDDMAAAVVHLAGMYDGKNPVNVGTGQGITIDALVRLLCKVSGFGGQVVYDPSKPDGTPVKILDITRLSASSWTPQVPLPEGLQQVWQAWSGRA